MFFGGLIRSSVITRGYVPPARELFIAHCQPFTVNKVTIYKASAGSGKTFTLAAEYIALLIAAPTAYRHILAVTFTHKATGEMKDRIVQQLYGIWTADPGSEAYIKAIDERLPQKMRPLPVDELRHRAGKALLLLLHDYSRFRVKTIDSFFQSVLQNLLRELGLNPNLIIELDADNMVNLSVDNMLRKLTSTSPELDWLAEYMDDQMDNGRSWNVIDAVKTFAKNITKEEYKQRGDELREQLNDSQLVRNYRQRMRQVVNEETERMKTFGDRFFQLMDEYGLTADDINGGEKKSAVGYFRKLQNGITDDKMWNKSTEKALASATNWGKGKSARRAYVEGIAAQYLMPLLQETEEARQEMTRATNSCNLSVQHIDKLLLLNRIDHELQLLIAYTNRFLLADTNDLLRQVVGKDDASFVFEKAGTEISRVMIDEFQDTSRMQWGNFRTLLLEGLAQGQGSLLVGDVKQAIYRWRNGDWGILERLTRRDVPQPFPTEVKTLGMNFRSQPEVVAFNNKFFTQASDHLSQEIGGGEAGELISNVYADAPQMPAKEGKAGFVKVRLIETPTKKEYTEAMLKSFGEEVKRLLNSGVRPDDMAILVRKNKEIPCLADYIGSTLGLPVTSNEAFQMDASPAVCVIVEAMRCLAYPDNKLARASLSANYAQLMEKAGRPVDWDEVLSQPDKVLPKKFKALADQLRLLPLYNLVEELSRLFELSDFEGQSAYLLAFFDAVMDYERKNTNDVHSLLAYWDETLHEKSIPAARSVGIRILTIHKSKGLEFHTVLIPFCDWELETMSGLKQQLVWCEPKESPYNALSLLPISFCKAMDNSIYQADFHHEQLQQWVDNLNLMYVAFTRASANLLIWGRLGAKRGRTMSQLLEALLPEMDLKTGDANEGEQVFQSGEICPSAMRKAVDATNKLMQKAEEEDVKATSTEPTVRFVQSNQVARFNESLADEDDQPQDDGRFIRRGNLLHALFQDIATLEDVQPALNRLAGQGLIVDEERADIEQVVEHAFAPEQVREWYDGSWKLYRECTILSREGGLTLSRRPDRVMTRGNETVVIDFKFARPRQKHIDQVREYVQLLTDMGRDPRRLHAYLWYVDQDKIEEVI